MTAVDREAKRQALLEALLAALKKENHITPEAARKETLTHSPIWKIGKKA